MPTVLLLDVSLSMCRPVLQPDIAEPYQLRNLAVHGLNSLLDFINQHCKLEFCSLIIFSSSCEILSPFTRDLESVKKALLNIDFYDKTCIETALGSTKNAVLEEWGGSVPCQIILVTDGSTGIGPNSLKQRLQDIGTKTKETEQRFPLPFPFPSKLHVVCLSNPKDSNLQVSIPLYQKLIDMNGGNGQVFVPEGNLNLKTVQQMFLKLAETYYRPFHGTLHCGNLNCNISLSPPPEACEKINDFDSRKVEMSTDILICGFLDINQASNPPALSRHLVLPIPPQSLKEEGKAVMMKQDIDASDDDAVVGNDEGKQPSFCVLLHGSLKVEGMVALCHLGEDWYGMLCSWADSKKKSNLMLSTFEPGLEVVPWLGKFTQIGPASLLPELSKSVTENSFPIKLAEKRSYAQNCVVWIRQMALQADIQKILRHARKLPDKTQNFYKELNKLRRGALAFGFYELLDGMAIILERECTLLPGSAHPDAALQLTHAASALRSQVYRDYNSSIKPLCTKFSSGD
ncbi:integrator complex subunit 14-like [Limulus polyphemus]|uniref:Integrator complex subunit 14 n=1 Tax=Limulus polyphemus TaxID=6850 RepID=A0ABM1BG82_LIMPO|nr:integrator complex subunit 14-like [Limulus polyphemus]XP_013781380.1 integrator complex subunit 14-like [Limulus polyphemus]XP_022249325.1 integrator complex subunit 14-like [Limulus polyphemus]